MKSEDIVESIANFIVNTYKSETNVTDELVNPSSDLAELDIDSIEHMKIIILIEEEYNFEFEKEELALDSVKTISDLAQFVYQKIQIISDRKSD